MQITHPLRAAQKFARGESYWRVVLTTGKEYSELDRVEETRNLDFTDERSWLAFQQRKRMRPLDWYLDIASTPDLERISELWLHTPAAHDGHVAIKITERNSAYIFNSSYMSLVEGRSPVAQIIGRVDEKARGTGIAFIWDVATQQIYIDNEASVLDFKAWRPGIANIGALAIGNMGITL